MVIGSPLWKTYGFGHHGLLPALFLVWAVCWGCAPTHEVSVPATLEQNDFERYFPAIYGDYLTWKPNKAIAVALGADGRFAFGYSQSRRSEQSAIDAALLECGKRAGWRNIKVPCMIYAVNNKKVIGQE